MARASIGALAVMCILSVPGSTGVSAMTISSDAPGNIFMAGKRLHFTVKDARDTLSYEVVSYFGATAARGTAGAGAEGARIELSGLRPGWYELRCRDSAGMAVAALGVVMDRGNKPRARESRICADAASAWLLSDALRPPFAHMLRLAGISWVRERLSWGQTEPEPGRFEWGKYQATADVLRREGVSICQIWHDSPAWTHPQNPNTHCPDDLRTVYRFAKAAAHQFAREIQAWEVWNEPDIGFWPDLSDRFAGLQKAAYWGLKDGNPRAIVLQGSLCRGVSEFERNFYDAGALDYFDVFNWHTYNVPSAYPKMLEAHRGVLREYDAAGRPAWLTEAGIGIHVPGGPDNRILSPEDQRRQCRFITQSAVMSLVAGNDRNFYFVLPDYMERETQFGALHRDLTPYPSFVALSAAANLLGVSEYLGEYKASGDVVAHVFSAGRGNVVVAWANEPGLLSIPTEKHGGTRADLFGAERWVPARDGKIRVRVGPEAVYLVDVGNAIEADLTKPKRLTGVRPNRPSRIVLVGHSDLSIVRDRDCYLLGYDQPLEQGFRFTVDVYNFDERNAASGVVGVLAPVGWTVESPRRGVRLDPMGRESLVFNVMPPQMASGALKLIARGRFGDEPVAPALSVFEMVVSRPLDWAHADRWQGAGGEWDRRGDRRRRRAPAVRSAIHRRGRPLGVSRADLRPAG
jgi:hypothetical protein